MHRRHTFRSHLVTATLAATLGAAVAGGIAFAATEASAPIAACVHKTSGYVRVVAEDSTCRRTERPLSWGTQGPAGPQGEPGPAGPEGPEGPAGPSGLVTTYVRTGSAATVYPGVALAAAQCDLPDDTILGGGYLQGTRGDLVASSRPVQANQGQPGKWEALLTTKHLPSTTPRTQQFGLTSYVICGRPVAG